MSTSTALRQRRLPPPQRITLTTITIVTKDEVQHLLLPSRVIITLIKAYLRTTTPMEAAPTENLL